MIGRSKKIKDILNKMAEKQKQLNDSKDLFERHLLIKELRDLKEIFHDMLNEGD